MRSLRVRIASAGPIAGVTREFHQLRNSRVTFPERTQHEAPKGAFLLGLNR
jgi:hypothetical protein